MRLFITGGAGFIGGHIIQRFSGAQIVSMDRRAHGHLADGDRVRAVRGDLRDLAQTREAIATQVPEWVFHLAAEHKDFGVSEEAFHDTNVTGLANLLAAMDEVGARKLAFFSSVAVYGDPDETSTEATATNPKSPYGRTKLEAENLVREWVDADARRTAIILRPVVVYGEGNVANMYRLIRQIDSGLYANVSGGEAVKSIAYVGNLVRALEFLLPRAKPGEVHLYNYSDYPQLSTREIAAAIARQLGRREPRSVPMALIRAAAKPFDWAIRLTGRDLPVSTNRIEKLNTSTRHASQLIRELGFEASVDNREGIRRMVDWYVATPK